MINFLQPKKRPFYVFHVPLEYRPIATLLLPSGLRQVVSVAWLPVIQSNNLTCAAARDCNDQGITPWRTREYHTKQTRDSDDVKGRSWPTKAISGALVAH